VSAHANPSSTARIDFAAGKDIKDADTFSSWIYINDSTQMDTTNIAAHNVLIYFNGTTQYRRYNITSQTITGWNKINVNLNNFYTASAGTWNPKNITRIYYVFNNVNSKDYIMRYDNLFFYNSSLYFNTTSLDRWQDVSGAPEKAELQTILQSGGANTTVISLIEDSADFNFYNLSRFDYDDFEVIIKVKRNQDLGSDVCGISLRNTGNLSIYSYANVIRAFGFSSTNTTTGATVNAEWWYAKLIVNGTTFQAYYAANMQHPTWILALTETIAIAPNGLYLYQRDAQCQWDNVIIRELMTSSYQTTGTYVVSGIYDSANSTDFDYERIYPYKDGVNLGAVSDNSPSDFGHANYTITLPGTYRFLHRVYDQYMNYAQNYTQYFYVDVGNLNITFLNEQTEEVMNGHTITLQCIGNLFGQNYTVTTGYQDALIPSGDYSLRYDANYFHPREYYCTINNGTDNAIELFLLNDSTAVSSIVTTSLLDEYSDDAQNVTIYLQRNYLSDDNVSIFKTVQMTRTNFLGDAALFVEPYSVWYKIIYLKSDGTLLKVTAPTPFFFTTFTDSVELTGNPWSSFILVDDVYVNLTFVNLTGQIYARMFYLDTDSILQRACLRVQRMTPQTLEDVCYNCTTSSSATISCLIDHTQKGTYRAFALLDTNSTGSWYNPLTVSYTNYLDRVIGLEGVWLTVILAGTIGLMGIGSLVGSLMLLLLGFVAMAVINVMIGFQMSYAIYLLVIIVMIIFFIKKSRTT
jgi:hypothetical protein